MNPVSDFNQLPSNDAQNKYDDITIFVRICTIVIFLVILLRVYARFIRRRRQRSALMGHQFYFTEEEPATLRNVGLDSAVLETLSIFVYPSSQISRDGLQCAVCLCEWEENEKVRLLPNCGHSFHVECIDMWCLWHSTCPLGRGHPFLEEPSRIGQVSATIPTGIHPNLNWEGQTASCEEEYDLQSPPNALSWCGHEEQMNADMDEGTSGGMSHIVIDIPKKSDVSLSPGECHMPNDSQSSPVSDVRSLTNNFTRDSERKISQSGHPGERDLEHDGAAQGQGNHIL